MGESDLRLFDVASGSGPHRGAARRGHHNASRPGRRIKGQAYRSPAYLVSEFHTSLGLVANSQPTLDLEPSLMRLRHSLLEEEVAELRDACDNHNIIGVADALADCV